jgi:hypothetical protein
MREVLTMRFSKRILSTLFLGFLLVGFRNTVLACDSCVLGAYTQERVYQRLHFQQQHLRKAECPQGLYLSIENGMNSII